MAKGARTRPNEYLVTYGRKICTRHMADSRQKDLHEAYGRLEAGLLRRPRLFLCSVPALGRAAWRCPLRAPGCAIPRSYCWSAIILLERHHVERHRQFPEVPSFALDGEPNEARTAQVIRLISSPEVATSPDFSSSQRSHFVATSSPKHGLHVLFGHDCAESACVSR